MARIDAVFQHNDGYKYNLVYSTAKKFLSSVARLRDSVFLHAVDYEKQMVIYPSTLGDYRYNVNHLDRHSLRSGLK
jgi:hypothetical protein